MDVWPRTHGDVTNHAIQLLEADGHGGVAAAFGEPATKALLFNGLRQADMGGGEFVYPAKKVVYHRWISKHTRAMVADKKAIRK